MTPSRLYLSLAYTFFLLSKSTGSCFYSTPLTVQTPPFYSTIPTSCCVWVKQQQPLYTVHVEIDTARQSFTIKIIYNRQFRIPISLVIICLWWDMSQQLSPVILRDNAVLWSRSQTWGSGVSVQLWFRSEGSSDGRILCSVYLRQGPLLLSLGQYLYTDTDQTHTTGVCARVSSMFVCNSKKETGIAYNVTQHACVQLAVKINTADFCPWTNRGLGHGFSGKCAAVGP